MSLKYTDVMKPEDISIAFCWLNYSSFVLPPTVSNVQREEMRKAFYAGFIECFKIMVDISDVCTVEQAGAALDRMSAEAKEFFDAMMKEHAPEMAHVPLVNNKAR